MTHTWITHKEKRILYSDFANFGADVEGLRADIEAGNQLIGQEPENSVLVLVDLRNTVISIEAAQILKESAASTKKYARKTALIGITTGFRKVLLDAAIRFSGRHMVALDDVEKAKDWLVEETD
jgi:hypothetical protein